MVQQLSITPQFDEQKRKWFFNGATEWRQDSEGTIYPPKWWDQRVYPADQEKSPDYFSQLDGDKPVPNYYASPTARVDYALHTEKAFDDLDLAVRFTIPIDSANYGGVVFRAQNQVQAYVLGIRRTGYSPHYLCTLWLQDRYGVRYELAHAEVPHSLTADLKTHPRNYSAWTASTPDWLPIRIQTVGAFVRIRVADRIVIEKRDTTYTQGFVGLFCMGFMSFRDLSLKGTSGTLEWYGKREEFPPFFYPGHRQLHGFNSRPMCVNSADGVTLVGWTHGHTDDRGKRIGRLLLTRSTDNAITWEKPYAIIEREIPAQGHPPFNLISLFEHKSGEITALIRERDMGGTGGPDNVIRVHRSRDQGKTWKVAGVFDTAGVHLYSSMVRLSNGEVLITGYYANTVERGDEGDDFLRLDNSVVFRSRDDGYTWGPPNCIDETNHDHNECMFAEGQPGHLVAFMRTLMAPYMWTSRSEDYGQNWTPVTQSGMGGSSTWLIKHSSGVLVMFIRDYGAHLRLSYDQGQTWTTPIFISPCCPMVGMCELNDGSILIVMFEGHRIPGYIRGLKFTIEEGKIIPGSDMPFREPHEQY